ncbi:hypothetical protein OPV22_012560 [Ensete ventricosum]|uniref:NAC domain-containing protein n=1 Tax=Ensete ventricosum TaxID=4639 RepID=A0AAV8PH76_ENSVE|nr:hypothetical protein OPV22_012560 [Ensete ventricosum]
MEESLPPGFRFHPTDEELITYYLSRKVTELGFATAAIADVDLNKCEPWDLPGKASMGQKEWYFFNLKDRKYPTGLRTNRATDAGYWKTTGKDKEIFHCGVLVGMKKTLVFYKGRAPKGEKTGWVMHEYRLHTGFLYNRTKEEWVVCRVFKKSSAGKKPQPDLPALLESPCELAGLINSSSSNGVQTNESMYHSDSMLDVNKYMNWVLAPWASGSLGAGFAPTHAILRALQLYGHNKQPEAMEIASLSSLVGQGDAMLGSGSRLSFPASSSTQMQSFDQGSNWRGY